MARAPTAMLSPEDQGNAIEIAELKRPDSLLTLYSHHTSPELPTDLFSEIKNCVLSKSSNLKLNKIPN